MFIRIVLISFLKHDYIQIFHSKTTSLMTKWQYCWTMTLFTCLMGGQVDFLQQHLTERQTLIAYAHTLDELNALHGLWIRISSGLSNDHLQEEYIVDVLRAQLQEILRCCIDVDWNVLEHIFNFLTIVLLFSEALWFQLTVEPLYLYASVYLCVRVTHKEMVCVSVKIQTRLLRCLGVTSVRKYNYYSC